MKRKTLNEIRYLYFLDPAGTNADRFIGLQNELMKNIFDWYINGGVSKDRNETITQFLQEFGKADISAGNIDMIFSNRNPLNVQKAIETAPSMEDLEHHYGKLGSCRLPEEGKSLDKTLFILDESTEPTIRFNSNFMGELHPHDNMLAYFAKLLAGFTNENAIARCVSPSTTFIENKTVSWLADLVGYDYSEQHQLNPDARFLPPGTITSGGTVANLTGLLVARERLKRNLFAEKYGLDPNSKEIQNISWGDLGRDGVLLCSKSAHYSMEKIGKYLEFGKQNVIRVDIDDCGRMKPKSLYQSIERCRQQGKQVIGVVATTGSTELGAIDPIDEITDITEGEGIYLHIDAAYGGGLLTSNNIKEKFKGIERADSVTIDGHKMLYTNYPCGGIVFRDKENLKFLDQNAAYILDKFKGEINHGSFTIEGSRPTDGILQLYSSFIGLGREGYETIVNHVVELTNYLYGKLEDDSLFRTLHVPEINSVCFQYIPPGSTCVGEVNNVNKTLNRLMYSDGTFYVGGTSNLLLGDTSGTWAQKVSIFHPYTEKENIDAMLDKMISLGPRAVHEVRDKDSYTGV